MAFHSQNRPPSIPRKLRSLGYHLLNPEPMHRMARSAYLSIASRCAKALSECEGVDGVFLRGGAVDRLTPAVSDLDFCLDLKPHPSPQQLLEWLGKISICYSRLQRRYWLPGELIVRTARSTSWRGDSYLDRLLTGAEKWSGNRWERHPSSSKESSLITLGLTLHQYLQSYISFREALLEGENSFSTASFLRDAQKTVAYAHRKAQWEILPLPAVTLFTNAFNVADEIARSAIKGTRAFEIAFSAEPRSLHKLAEQEALESHWLEAFQTFTGASIGLTPSSIPFHLRVEANESPLLFDAFVEFSIQEPELSQKIPISFITPAMEKAYQLGWSGWDTRKVLCEYIDTHEMASIYYWAIVHSARARLSIVLGQTISSSAWSAWHLEQLCLEAIVLASHHLPATRKCLLEKGRFLLPKTFHCLSTLWDKEQAIPPESTVDVYLEIEALLHDVLSAYRIGSTV